PSGRLSRAGVACRSRTPRLSRSRTRSLVQDDSVDRAGLVAEAAVDAFHHIDVEAGGQTRTVVAPRPRLDGDGLCRADRLTQLAGNAALLPVRITPQRKLAA